MDSKLSDKNSIQALNNISQFINKESLRAENLSEKLNSLNAKIKDKCSHEILIKNYDRPICIICGTSFYKDVNFRHYYIESLEYNDIQTINNIIKEIAYNDENY